MNKLNASSAVSVFKGAVGSISLNTLGNDTPASLELHISLLGEDGESDTRLSFSGFQQISLHWLLLSEYIITVSELESAGWEERTFHVLVNSCDDFDFYATSVKVMRDL